MTALATQRPDVALRRPMALPDGGLPLGPTEDLLASGGDARITLDSVAGVNRYGCGPVPDPVLLPFGSSTASVISERGFAAADSLRSRLASELGHLPAGRLYAREMARLRDEMKSLCGLNGLPGVEILFAASGTDIHLMAAGLVAGPKAAPTRIIMVEAAETGSGVAKALNGRHFSSRAALGEAVEEGAALHDFGGVEVIQVALRDETGASRPLEQIDENVERLTLSALEAGQRVLITLVDVSKTGLMAPGLGRVMSLKRCYPNSVDVLVDACQFRIGAATLEAYVATGAMVAVTGSKFLTGPTFSGALILPWPIVARHRNRPLPEALFAYSVRGDWPANWPGADGLGDAANFGLLLRWEAAMAELRAFSRIPLPIVCRFLSDFQRAVMARLDADPSFEPLAPAQPDRSALDATPGWDHIPTIFPFLLRRHDAARRPFTREETAALYKRLQHENFCQLGQPVGVGHYNGVPVSALRLCASARIVTAAVGEGAVGPRIMIDRALQALDHLAIAARAF